MKIIEDLPKYGAEQGVSEEEAWQTGMEDPPNILEMGNEIYTKA